jgi:multicomponent Na+:H+ antiporter subunit E
VLERRAAFIATGRLNLIREGRISLAPALSRATLFAVLWLLLSGGVMDGWAYGAAAAALAAWLSLRLYTPGQPRVRVWRAAVFAPMLLVRGFLGGLDVARCALDPRLPVRPGWTVLRLRRQFAPANVLLGGVISILPGSLAAGPDEGTMNVHMLNAESAASDSLAQEERRVHWLFGLAEAERGRDE